MRLQFGPRKFIPERGAPIPSLTIRLTNRRRQANRVAQSCMTLPLALCYVDLRPFFSGLARKCAKRSLYEPDLRLRTLKSMGLRTWILGP
jgi:hypothetical protein